MEEKFFGQLVHQESSEMNFAVNNFWCRMPHVVEFAEDFKIFALCLKSDFGG